MRILFVTPTYPPMPGGGERYAAALAAHLRRLGHTIDVITSAAVSEHQLWDGAVGEMAGNMPAGSDAVRLAVQPFPGGRSGLMAYRKAMVLLSALPGDQSTALAALAARVPNIVGLQTALTSCPPVDIIHAFNASWESAMIAAAALARTRNVPLIVTPFAHFGAGAQDRVARNSTMDHQLRVLREAARVMVLTEVERQELADYGVPLDSVTVLGGGADELPAAWPAAVAALGGLDLPDRFTLFVGRASRDKGAIDAAKAVVELRQRGEDIVLVLAGSTSPEFTRWLTQLPPAEQAGIIPLGIVTEETKHALLERAAMLLLPSRSDSFGIVLLEAWQHGRPVIGARAGGIPGVIDDGCNGLLVPYGDVVALAAAMARLLHDPALSATLGANGLRKVTTELTWERAAAKADAAYREVVGAT